MADTDSTTTTTTTTTNSNDVATAATTECPVAAVDQVEGSDQAGGTVDEPAHPLPEANGCAEGEGVEEEEGTTADGGFSFPEDGEKAAASFVSDVMGQQPKLDVHLALIEEQFRRGFDERYTTPSLASQRQIWEDPVETLRANKIFREVSRGLGGEWRGVFDELMAPYPREIAEIELGKISMSSPIIQGYKALSCWKEVSGRSYSLMKLVEVLRNGDFDDIADAVIHIIDHDSLPDSKDKQAKPVQRRKSDLAPQKNPEILDNRRLLLIAKKIEGNYESLAKELGIPDEELAEIKESEGQTYQGTFKVLWSWREAAKQPPTTQAAEGEASAPVSSDLQVLKAALEKVDLKAVADQLDSVK